MFLYIVRHGIAFEHDEWDGPDALRPLTDEGIEEARAVFERLRKQKKLQAEVIWSSPLKRALQTAELAGAALKLPVETVAEVEFMSLKELKEQLDKMDKLPDRLMLVGHEPGCGELIGDLLGDSHEDYALKKCGVALLKGSFERSGMKLEWKLKPKDILK